MWAGPCGPRSLARAAFADGHPTEPNNGHLAEVAAANRYMGCDKHVTETTHIDGAVVARRVHELAIHLAKLRAWST
jgi:hypothetical protein